MPGWSQAIQLASTYIIKITARALRLAGLIASFMNALVTQLTLWSMVPPTGKCIIQLKSEVSH